MTPYYEHDGCTIYHSDFRNVMGAMDEASVQAVITDPPYPREFSDVWRPLGEYSARVLEPGGSLLSIIPQYAVHEILPEISRFLKWRWMLCMDLDGGPHPRMAMGVEVTWKPIGWWVKGAWPTGRGFRSDRVRSGWIARDGSKGTKLHKWQQSESWAAECLRFVPAGGLVVDPMVGSGTLIFVARMLGYPAIGIDSDEAACEIAANRLSQRLMFTEASA